MNYNIINTTDFEFPKSLREVRRMSEIERKNLTEEDVISILTRELPRLIIEHPEMRNKFIDMMSDVLVKKDDMVVWLSEMKILRQDFNTEMKSLREEFQADMKALREEFQAEMKSLREEFQAEMKSLREEFQVDMNTLHEEFQTEMKSLREEFHTEMKALREEFQASREEFHAEMKSLREEFQASREEFHAEMKSLRKEFQASREEFHAEMKSLREEFQTEMKALRKDLQSELKALDNKVVGLGARWGIMSEEAFRSGLKGILADELGLKVEFYQGYDKEGYVFGRPDQVELDIVVKDGFLIVMEIRSSMSKGDVYTFQRKIEFYEKVHNVKVSRKIILSPFIDYRAVPAAQSLGMEMYSSASEFRT